jgi:uncharacterized protein (DUF433 family)
VRLTTIAAEPVPLSMDATGTVRVKGTRLTLDTILGAYQRGDTPEEITEGFPDLDLGDVHAILTYYFRHREEVDAYLAERDAKAAEHRRAFEALRGDQPSLREKVLSRHAQRQPD